MNIHLSRWLSDKRRSIVSLKNVSEDIRLPLFLSFENEKVILEYITDLELTVCLDS
jgi:hypothetical protein